MGNLGALRAGAVCGACQPVFAVFSSVQAGIRHGECKVGTESDPGLHTVWCEEGCDADAMPSTTMRFFLAEAQKIGRFHSKRPSLVCGYLPRRVRLNCQKIGRSRG